MIRRLKAIYDNLGTDAAWQKSLALRIAVAGCFIGHGMLAYQASTNFGSEWSGWVRSLFPGSIEYQASEIFLKTVALIDIIDGLLLLVPKIPKSALVWVLTWGALTAASRLYFLGVYVQPIEINGLNALAEFLRRTPNWMIPLLLVATTSPILERKYQVLTHKAHWLNFAVICQLMGIFLHNAYEARNPFFEFELLKVGMPQWFFYNVTMGSIIGILLVLAVHKFPVAMRPYRLLLVIVPLTYICAEGFLIFFRNLPGGFSFTAVRFVSSFAQYYCMWMWSKAQMEIFYPTNLALRKPS